MKRVLITGITGYIGSQLARALVPEHTVYGLVREPLNTTYLPQELLEKITLLSYDGTGKSVRAALEVSRPDVVYHLAAHYTGAREMDDVQRLVQSNLAFGAELLAAMSEAGCRQLVYATTVTTHVKGDHYQPLSFYAATKQAFSDLVEFYTSTGLMNAVAIALADTYGPGDHRPKVLNLIRQAALNGTPIDLTSGNQVFDVTYIDDVTRAFIGALELLHDAPHQFFQLGSENPCTLRETVELMLQINGLTLQANWGGRPEPERQIKEKLCIYPAPPNWRPEVSLKEGLRRFWAGT